MDENGAIESVAWLLSMKVVPLHCSERNTCLAVWYHVCFPWPLLGQDPWPMLPPAAQRVPAVLRRCWCGGSSGQGRWADPWSGGVAPARHCTADRSLGPGGSGTAGQTHPTLLKLPALPSPQMRHKSSCASCELQHHLAPPAMASRCCAPVCHLGDKNQPKSLVSVLSCGSPSREAFLTSDILKKVMVLFDFAS